MSVQEDLLPTPRTRSRRVKWITLIVGALTLYAVIAWCFPAEPKGWLHSSRKETAAELFQRNGVPLENVAGYSQFIDKPSVKVRLREWKEAFDWRDAETWLRVPNRPMQEWARVEILPGAHHLLDSLGIEPDMIVVWKERGKPDPGLPKSSPIPYVDRYFDDLADVGLDSVETHLHVTGSVGISSLPPFVRVEHGIEQVRLSDAMCIRRVVALKVEDPVAWLKTSAAMVERKGGWVSKKDDRFSVTFVGGDIVQSGREPWLCIFFNEGSSMVWLERTWRTLK